jgi:hypothetical protein
MNKRVAIIAIGLVGLVAVAEVAWYLVSPPFINRAVDEAFPDAQELAANPDQLMAMPEEDRAEVKDEVMEAGANMPDSQAGEAMPDMPAEPSIVAQGTFVGADDFHQGSGSATIYELPEGSHVLRFEEFSVVNGPDLHVFLLQGESMTGSVDLGSLKGNLGDQNYDIPAGTDVSGFTSVSIYCVPFHVTFATASFE